MKTEKMTYTTPQLKKIYAAPRLTKHGSVAQLTGSVLPGDGLMNGTTGCPTALNSLPSVCGTAIQLKDLLAGQATLASQALPLLNQALPLLDQAQQLVEQAPMQLLDQAKQLLDQVLPTLREAQALPLVD